MYIEDCEEMKTYTSPQTDHTIHIYESTAVLILIVAIGSILISFFGCCGAFKESKCMIGTVKPCLVTDDVLHLFLFSISSSCWLSSFWSWLEL